MTTLAADWMIKKRVRSVFDELYNMCTDISATSFDSQKGWIFLGLDSKVGVNRKSAHSDKEEEKVETRARKQGDYYLCSCG